jgi:hypothetical protein
MKRMGNQLLKSGNATRVRFTAEIEDRYIDTVAKLLDFFTFFCYIDDSHPDEMTGNEMRQIRATYTHTHTHRKILFFLSIT